MTRGVSTPFPILHFPSLRAAHTAAGSNWRLVRTPDFSGALTRWTMFILGRSTPYAPGVLNPGIMLKGPSHHRGISYAELPPNEPTTHGSPPIPFHRPPTRLGQPSLQLSHISVRSSSPKVQTRLDLPVSTQTTTGHAEYRLQGQCRSSAALGSVRSVRFHSFPPTLEDTGCPIPPLCPGRS